MTVQVHIVHYIKGKSEFIEVCTKPAGASLHIKEVTHKYNVVRIHVYVNGNSGLAYLLIYTLTDRHTY